MEYPLTQIDSDQSNLLQYLYASISFLIFGIFSLIYFLLTLKLSKDCIDFKAKLFLLTYFIVFLLKAIISGIRLINLENFEIINFILSFIWTMTTDCTEFLLITFIFDIKEVNIKLKAASY
jgi:hypothetical protein